MITPSTDTLVIIPARWHSSRFPGKPLTLLSGKSLLERVYCAATRAIANLDRTAVIVATEDERVLKHAQSFGANAIMTPASCASGTDRAYATLTAITQQFSNPSSQTSPQNSAAHSSIRWLVNLQGDAPLTPAAVITQLIQQLRTTPSINVLTPITQLSWNALDALRDHKKNSPHSGTTVTCDSQGRALWFSKQIIPAIRHEVQQRQQSTLSPVWRHLGLYGYRREILEQFVALPEAHYETLEGLEQLRFLENHIPVHTFSVDLNDITLGNLSALSGVDTPEDAQRIEEWIKHHGEPV